MKKQEQYNKEYWKLLEQFEYLVKAEILLRNVNNMLCNKKIDTQKIWYQTESKLEKLREKIYNLILGNSK